jgi:hypothetical protein
MGVAPFDDGEWGDWGAAMRTARHGNYDGASVLLAIRAEGATCSTDAFDVGDIAETIGTAEGENDGPDWVWIGRLTDGRFAGLSAGCDYTGWG